MSSKLSFRCKTCGRLMLGETAGDGLLPHTCPVCNAGLSFHPKTGQKIFDPNNWEILSECTDERLAELGLTRDDVASYKPANHSIPRTGRTVSVYTTESITSKDETN